VRATAIMALAELQAVVVEPKLLTLCADAAQPMEVRLAAVKALMRLGSRQGVELFWTLMNQPNLDLEPLLTFALALGATRDPRYREQLAERLEDADFGRAFSAALALAGDPQAKTILLHALDHSSAGIRRYAILGLEPYRDREVLKALADTVNDDLDPMVRILCASELTAAGMPEFRVVLWNALDNRSEDLRSEALIALGRSADPEVLRQLKWYLRREPSVPVRQTIWRILREHAETAGK
jgi:HEAT repeat protein